MGGGDGSDVDEGCGGGGICPPQQMEEWGAHCCCVESGGGGRGRRGRGRKGRGRSGGGGIWWAEGKRGQRVEMGTERFNSDRE